MERKYVVIEYNFLEEIRTFFDTKTEAVNEACNISKLKNKCCTVADVISDNLADPENWNTDSGNNFHLSIRNGEIEVNEHDYTSLKSLTLANQNCKKYINALGRWFERYGERYWNGSEYTIDKENSLRPRYDDDGEIEGWELL